jgi:hypothetical protein
MSETLGGGTSSSSPLSPFPEVREEEKLLASCVGEVPPFLMGGSSLLGNAVVGSHSIRLAGTVSLVDGNIVRIDIFFAVNNPCRNAEQCVNTSSSCLYRRKDAQFVHVVKHLGDGFSVTLP